MNNFISENDVKIETSKTKIAGISENFSHTHFSLAIKAHVSPFCLLLIREGDLFEQVLYRATSTLATSPFSQNQFGHTLLSSMQFCMTVNDLITGKSLSSRNLEALDEAEIILRDASSQLYILLGRAHTFLSHRKV